MDWSVRIKAQQTRRHGGAYRGRAPKWLLVPPHTKTVPPKRGLCPKEINRIGATGLQIEAQIGDFFGDHLRTAKKNCLNLWFRAENSLQFQWKPFFFLEITCFRPENFFEFLLLTLFTWSDWDKFLVPPCPSRIHTKSTARAPPKFISAPPVTLSWRRAWGTTTLLQETCPGIWQDAQTNERTIMKRIQYYRLDTPPKIQPTCLWLLTNSSHYLWLLLGCNVIIRVFVKRFNFSKSVLSYQYFYLNRESMILDYTMYFLYYFELLLNHMRKQFNITSV